VKWFSHGFLCVAVSIGMSGCGGSGSSAGPGGADGKTPPPRAGEDKMKEAMEKLVQKGKGKSVPGLPKSTTKK
jgi:hypothetical protein